MDMKRVILWIVFQVTLTGFVLAQTLGFSAPPKLDSSYVSSNWDTWSARVFSTLKTYQFSVRSRESDTHVRYTPTRKWAVGVGITYKFILLDVGFGIPVNDEATKHFDLKLSFRLKNHVVGLGYWRYKGFNLHDSYGKKYDFRGDVRNQLFGFNYYHNFDNRKVPLREQINGTSVQRKSAGTFGLGGYWFWNQLKADSSVIPKELDELFNDDAKVHFASQFSLGVIAGFAYSFVLPRNFFLVTAVLPGAGINVGEIRATNTYTPPLLPSAKINLRAAVGYMSDKVYVILSGSGDVRFNNWGSKNRYSYLVGQVKFVVGYRFTSEIGFLEKIANRLQEVQFH